MKNLSSPLYLVSYADEINFMRMNIKQARDILFKWRDNIHNEINFIIFTQREMNSTNQRVIANLKQHNTEAVITKLSQIMSKLLEWTMKELDLISQGIVSLKDLLQTANNNNNNNNKTAHVSSPTEICRKDYDLIPKHFSLKLQNIRANYNAIVDNINKTISSSDMIYELRQKFITFDIVKQNEQKRSLVTESVMKENDKNENEWIQEIKSQLKEISNNVNPTAFEEEKEPIAGINETIHKHEDILKPYHLLEEFKKDLKLTRYKPGKDTKDDYKNILKTKNINLTCQEFKNKTYDEWKMITECKRYCIDVLDQVRENCVKHNERAQLDKMKTDNFQLNRDIDALLTNINVMNENYKLWIRKMTVLEEEQLEWVKQNKKLVEYIKARKMCGEHKDFRDVNCESSRSKGSGLNGNMKQMQVLSTLNTQNTSSVDMYNNINCNLQK